MYTHHQGLFIGNSYLEPNYIFRFFVSKLWNVNVDIHRSTRMGNLWTCFPITQKSNCFRRKIIYALVARKITLFRPMIRKWAFALNKNSAIDFLSLRLSNRNDSLIFCFLQIPEFPAKNYSKLFWNQIWVGIGNNIFSIWNLWKLW